jgi:hypothetical protein
VYLQTVLAFQYQSNIFSFCELFAMQKEIGKTTLTNNSVRKCLPSFRIDLANNLEISS